MNVFNIDIEFDRNRLHQLVNNCAGEGGKGYICFVDATMLSLSRKNSRFLEVLRQSMVNSCDGGSIAAMVNRIYHTHVRAYNGPDFFEHMIGQDQYRQLLLGSTAETFQKICDSLQERHLPVSHVSHLPVPFLKVEEFDYPAIAAQINALNPDIIWVSLGAPKQEQFMSLILPHVHRGVLCGIGAAFNFYIGNNIQPKFHLGAFRFIWLDRIYREPRKQLTRVWKILRTLPLLYMDEYRRKKSRS